ncbi:uncharacterized protein EDB91DRAFT_1091183 [Suillus paluster]|uniref:uncharacterized protein n=1 Tax=Suillus paluster TaxID=48578 RepID=UPI001B87C76E|nr:uncharacterized protein EDB91DRAFT_1091183 [Suillus paluster]KAG1717235.1 hypothetical protein EDB91DRAFT_1091183 [Suillus paluster]
MEPGPDQLPTPSSLNRDTVKPEPESMMSTPPSALDRQSGVSRLSRFVEGVEIVDADLDCLRSKGSRITGTVMNAYASLVPDKENSLTQAGCIILSSFVPNLIRGETSCNTTLEKIVSVRSKSKILASRRWAIPLCGGSPPHWVLGWVDWSAHEIGFFDSLGTNPEWADQPIARSCDGFPVFVSSCSGLGALA